MNRSSLASCLRASEEAVEQGVVRAALMRADKRTKGLRDGEGEEEVWPGELFCQVMV